MGGANSVKAEEGIKTPLLLLKNRAINTTDFDITPIGTSTLTTDNLYAATFTSKASTKNVFQYQNLDVRAYDKAVIKYSILDANEWRVNTPVNHYALPSGTDQTYEIDLSGVETYSDFTVFSSYQNHTVGSSITISEVYLYKNPFFDAFGNGTVDKSKLTATGGLTYDPSTGALSSNGTEGSLVLEFETPVDMRNLFQFNVANSGQTGDILSRLEFYDEDDTKINTWNGLKLGNKGWAEGIDDHATNAFLNHKPVKKMVWPSDANASNDGKTATITSVEFFCKTIACAKAGETQLNTLDYFYRATNEAEWSKVTPTWGVAKATDTYYGDGSSKMTHYVDLTDYSELRIYRDNKDEGFRAFFFTGSGDTGADGIEVNKDNSAVSWNATNKCYVIDLTKITPFNEKVWLIAIKSSGWGVNTIVNNIVVYNTPAANAPQYTLTGSGMQLAETVAALADASATCIDATGVTGITTNSEAGRTLLTSANPNCLFLGKVGNGYLSNTKNVVDDGTCANLVLTDGYPFKAPADFTATKASYSTTINAEAGAGTLCLPFAAAIPGGVTAYTLTYTSGDKAAATPVETTIPANTPVLLNGSDEKVFTGSGAVSASTANKSGALTGVFEATTVPVNSYVLQNGTSGLGFYKVESGDIVANPFRAYLTAQALGARSISITYGGVTGINDVKAKKVGEKDVYYNLNGQRVSNPTKGVFIKNGVKVSF